jgi:hypothetical protein
MNVDKLIKYGSVTLAGLCLITIGVNVRATKKAKTAVKNYNEAIDYLAYKTPVVISNDIIKEAASKAADKAAEDAIKVVREDIARDVKVAISDMRKDIEEEIRKSVSESVERSVDMDELKLAVTTRACSKITDKILNGFGKYAEPITNGIMKALAEKGGLR